MEFIAQMLHLFQQGGPIMYIMALCSLLTVMIAFERIFYFRKITQNDADLQLRIRQSLERGILSETIQLCEKNQPNVVAEITAAGVKAMQQGASVENALEGAAAFSAANLRKRLDTLSMLVTLSPILGLLGTVIGMIQSFSVLNLQNGQPMAITGGVGEALIATATGLTVATAALVLHNIFSHKVNNMITNIEQMMVLVLHHASLKKLKWRDVHEIA